MSPRVSLIIATYNYAHYVTEALDSLLDQTFEDFEAIVIDDASTDNTREVLARYAHDPRVRLVFNDANEGNIGTRNHGLRLAHGEYVGVVDADDFCLRPDALERLVEVLDRHPDVGFVYSAYQLADEHSRPFRLFQPWPNDFVRRGLDEFRHLIFRNYVPHTGTLVRRSFLSPDIEHTYDPDLPHAADWDIWLRLAAKHSVGYLAEAYFAYRLHGSNMSIAALSPQRENDEFYRTVQKAFAALPASAPAEVRALQPQASRAALLNTSWGDRSLGRVSRSWQGLIDAARRAPDLLTTSHFYGALARLLLLTVVGHGRYERVAAWRSRRLVALGER